MPFSLYFLMMVIILFCFSISISSPSLLDPFHQHLNQAQYLPFLKIKTKLLPTTVVFSLLFKTKVFKNINYSFHRLFSTSHLLPSHFILAHHGRPSPPQLQLPQAHAIFHTASLRPRLPEPLRSTCPTLHGSTAGFSPSSPDPPPPQFPLPASAPSPTSECTRSLSFQAHAFSVLRIFSTLFFTCCSLSLECSSLVFHMEIPTQLKHNLLRKALLTSQPGQVHLLYTLSWQPVIFPH